MKKGELEARLREWARLSAAPLEVPPARPPTDREITRRLREATDLWVTCVRLGELAPRANGPSRER